MSKFFLGKLFSGKGKVSPTIKSVKPSVPTESQRRSAVQRKRAVAQGVGGKPTNVDKIKKTFAPKSKIKFDAKKSDLDKSGSLSPYEKRRGMAIAKAMAKRKKKVI